MEPSINPTLTIDPLVYAKVQYLTKKYQTTEWAIFLRLRKTHPTKPEWLAYDIIFPKQAVTTTTVEIDAANMREVYKTLTPEEDGHLHRYLCHLHSHNCMSAYWSASDIEQQASRDDLGYYDDYRFYIVVNNDNMFKCTLVVYEPCYFRVENVFVIEPETVPTLDDSTMKELDTLFTENVSGTLIPISLIPKYTPDVLKVHAAFRICYWLFSSVIDAMGTFDDPTLLAFFDAVYDKYHKVWDHCLTADFYDISEYWWDIYASNEDKTEANTELVTNFIALLPDPVQAEAALSAFRAYMHTFFAKSLVKKSEQHTALSEVFFILDSLTDYICSEDDYYEFGSI